MKRRGFTLIEVLAVIVILGFLISLIVPVVNDLIKDSEDSLESRQISSIIDATRQYVAMNSELLPDPGVSVCISLSELVSEGVIDNEVIINPKTKQEMSGCVLINYSNDYNQYEYSYSYFDSSFYAQNIFEFYYTGHEQEFVAPKNGIYKLEVWGAQGGEGLCNEMSCSKYNGSYIDAIGGYGGYSVGKIELKAGDKLYINVGGKGEDGQITRDSSYRYNGKDSLGGYNGGGLGTWDRNDNEVAGGGGGATHIAKVSGLLSTLSSNINSILIVSGGGGGGSWVSQGGSGGGISGGPAGAYSSVGPIATQNSGYQFGKGQDAQGVGDSSGHGGGGGGFYGGFESTRNGSTSGNLDFGGGGSGYIGNLFLIDRVMYCYNCSESSNDSTKTISTTGTSNLKDTVNCPNGFSLDPISKCAKAGDGYAKVTFESER